MGIVVKSLDQQISFFNEIGLKLEGRTMIEGDQAGRITGLGDQKEEITRMVISDGHSRLELYFYTTAGGAVFGEFSPTPLIGKGSPTLAGRLFKTY